MDAALYARISSDMQIDNFSISAQVNLLKDYCHKSDINIFEIYIDEAQKGWKENRPALQKMIKDSKNFDVVLVHKFDRFARKAELSQRLKSQLRENKVKVISITEPIEDTPIGYFKEGILELLAQYQIDNLSHDIKKGKTERAMQGYWNGYPLFGYDLKDGLLVINDKETEIVRKIYDLYLNNGKGVSKIADYLNKNNIPTKLNGKFTPTRISYMLKNPTYIGKIYYGGNIYQGKHEAIIENEQYEKACNLLKSHNYNPGTGRKSYRTFNYSFFYLLDIARCSECGRKFVIRYNKYNSYYVCGLGYRPSLQKCKNKRYHVTKSFEKQIEELLKSFTKGEHIDFTIADVDLQINTATEKSLKVIENKLIRAKEAYMNEVFTLEEYKQESEKLRKDKNSLITELNRPAKYVNPNMYKNKIKNIWNDFITEKDISLKRAILQQVIRNIYVDYDGKTKFEFI